MYNAHHGNGKILYILNKPLPKNSTEIQVEVTEWKRLLSQQYDTLNDPVWRIRINLLTHLANNDDDKILVALTNLSICPSHYDMYQHLAFLKRIAIRFGNKKWVKEFEKRQRVWIAQHR